MCLQCVCLFAVKYGRSSVCLSVKNVILCVRPYFSVLLTMDRLIQQTVDYTRERKAFGKSILDNQYVHFRLAELETEVEALRSLVYRATGKNCGAVYNISDININTLQRQRKVVNLEGAN